MAELLGSERSSDRSYTFPRKLRPPPASWSALVLHSLYASFIDPNEAAICVISTGCLSRFVLSACAAPRPQHPPPYQPLPPHPTGQPSFSNSLHPLTEQLSSVLFQESVEVFIPLFPRGFGSQIHKRNIPVCVCVCVCVCVFTAILSGSGRFHAT